MKLLGINKSNITKDKNGKNVHSSEIVKVLFIHCNIVNNDCQQDSQIFIHLFLINRLVNHYIFLLNILYF